MRVDIYNILIHDILIYLRYLKNSLTNIFKYSFQCIFETIECKKCAENNWYF